MKYLLLVLALISGKLSATNLNPLELTKLSDRAYIVNSTYSANIGLIETNEGVVLIDPAPGKKLLADLKDLTNQLFNATELYIVNTHDHEDHSGGNEFFIENGAKFIQEDFQFEGISKKTVSSHSTQDNIYYHRQSNSIFVGDIYDTSWHPTFYAGGTNGLSKAVETILKMGDQDTLVIPGHGKPSNKAQLKAFLQATLDWVSTIERLKSAGKTITEMKDDARVLAILDRFNVSKKSVFLPEKSLTRFIERTFKVIENPH